MAAEDPDVEVGIESGRWLRGSEEFSRVLGFSDGVFGFALTLLVAGIVVLREVMRTYGITEIEVSERDILHGAALEAAELPEPEEGAAPPGAYTCC